MALLAALFPLLLMLTNWQTAFAEAPALPLYVNVGSSNSYRNVDGIRYLPDQEWRPERAYGFVGGAPRQRELPAPIAGRQDYGFLESQRHGWQAYRVNALKPGRYIVVLSFAERRAQGPNQSVFSVDIEGETVLSGLDLFATAGLDRAYERAFLVDVDDGELSISASAIVGETQLAALAVHAAETTPALPAPPDALEATPSYNAIILTWAGMADPAIDGYHVYRGTSGGGPFDRITAAVVAGDSYVDHFVELEDGEEPAFAQWAYRVTSVDVYGNESGYSATVTARALDPTATDLPVYELEIAPEDLAALQADIDTDEEAPASLLVEGRRYPAEVRFRGHIGRSYSKKSWKIIFRDESPIAPRDRLNLRSQYEDSSLLRGQLTSMIYEHVGIRPPMSRYVLLFVNGEYAGLYNDFEQVDDQFLERTGRNPQASIYAAEWTDFGNWADVLESVDQYHTAYSKESNKGSGYGDLITFIEALNFTDDGDVADLLARKLEVQRFLDYYAAVVLTQNMDFTRHNVFLVHDLEADRWEVIPWDPDYTWGIVYGFSRDLAHDMPVDMGTAHSPDVFNGPNRLLTRVLQTPSYRAYYCSRLRSLVNISMPQTQFAAAVDDLYAQIEEAAKADWHKFGWERNDWFEGGPERIKAWFEDRRSHIDAELENYCGNGRTLLSVNEVMPENQSTLCDPDEPAEGNCHEPWFELYNPGLTPVSLQGLYVAIGSAASDLYQITHPLTVPPLGHAILWADGEPAQGPNHTSFRLQPSAGVIGLYEADRASLIDSLAFKLPPPGRSWGRMPDGAQTTGVLAFASPGSRNRFSPAISLVSPAGQQAEEDEPIDVAVEVFSNNDVVAVDLYYAAKEDGWRHIKMARARHGRYQATLPPQPLGSLVKYYVVAQDDEGLTARGPSNDASDHYILDVGRRTKTIRISRFTAGTAGVGDSEEAGWVELHNYGSEPVALAGLYLSNDVGNSRLSPIDDTLIMDAESHLIFVADSASGEAAHLDFRLDYAGGIVALFQQEADRDRLIDMHRYGDQLENGFQNGCEEATITWITSVSRDPDERPFAHCFTAYLPAIQ